jgi:26S proteasome regulatory subunit N8
MDLLPNALPHWVSFRLDPLFTGGQLLVVYLSSLLRAVIALHALVDNKATIGWVELEEGGGEEKDKEKDKDKKGKNNEKKDEKDRKNDWSKSDSKGL